MICSPSFRTGPIRYVPGPEEKAVDVEYGLAPKAYGSTLEIDHIVSLELGGSNDIANIYPEKADAAPGYHVKDKLENKLHTLVCSGTMTLRAAQRRIASNWQALYKQVLGRRGANRKIHDKECGACLSARITTSRYKDAAGEFRWRFYAPNGRVMADSGQRYAEKSSCTEATDTICREANDGVSIDDAT